MYHEIHKPWFIVETLIQQLHNVLPRQEIADFLRQRTIPINQRIIPSELRLFLNIRLARFQTHIPESLNQNNSLEQKKIPEAITWKNINGEAGLVRKVAECLNPMEQVSIALTCQRNYRLINTFWKNNTYTAERLNYRLQLINDFDETLNEEIAQKKCFDNRIHYTCNSASSINLSFILIFGVSTSILIYYGSSENKTYLYLFAFIPLLLFTASLIDLALTTCNFRGPKRFYDLSIDQCSENIQKKFTSLKTAFRWSDSKPLTDMDSSISVKRIRKTLQTQRNLIKAQIEELDTQKTDALPTIYPVEIVINKYSTDTEIDDDLIEEKRPMLA